MYWFYWADNGQTPKLVLSIIRLIKKNLTNYRIVNNKTIRKYIKAVDSFQIGTYGTKGRLL